MIEDLILFQNKQNELMTVNFKNGYAFITDPSSKIAVCSKTEMPFNGCIEFRQLKKMKGVFKENFAMILKKNEIELKTDSLEHHFNNSEFSENPYFLNPDFTYNANDEVKKFLKVACKFSNAEVCNHVICVENFMACTDGESVFIVKLPFKWDFRFSFSVEFAKKVANVKDVLESIYINSVGIQFNFTEFCANSTISHEFDSFEFNFLNEKFEPVLSNYNSKELKLFLDLNDDCILNFENGIVKNGKNVFIFEECSLNCNLTSKHFNRMLPYFKNLEQSDVFVKSETENYICGVAKCV